MHVRQATLDDLEALVEFIAAEAMEAEGRSAEPDTLRKGIGVALTADNLTDDDYQQFPGTPAVGRQISLSARYQW